MKRPELNLSVIGNSMTVINQHLKRIEQAFQELRAYHAEFFEELNCKSYNCENECHEDSAYCLSCLDEIHGDEQYDLWKDSRGEK